jgi:hypothetical protein
MIGVRWAAPEKMHRFKPLLQSVETLNNKARAVLAAAFGQSPARL